MADNLAGFPAPLDHPHLAAWREAFRSVGDEPFDGGADRPRAGEVVWVDEVGVTCRRWNCRQGVRTRLTDSTTRAYFLFDALPAFSDADLAAAMDDRASAWPGGRLESSASA